MKGPGAVAVGLLVSLWPASGRAEEPGAATDAAAPGVAATEPDAATLLTSAWKAVRKNQPDEATALLERARALGVEDAKLEAAIAATPEAQKRRKREEEAEREKAVEDILVEKLKLDTESNVLRLEDADQILLKAIVSGDVVGFATRLDSEAESMLQGATGDYQREQAEARLRKEPRFVDQLARVKKRLQRVEFVTKSAARLNWTKPQFELALNDRGPQGLTQLEQSVFTEELLDFAIEKHPRLRCSGAKPWAGPDCVFLLNGMPKDVMAVVENPTTRIEFRWVGPGRYVRFPIHDGDEFVELQALTSVRVHILDADGKELWVAK